MKTMVYFIAALFLLAWVSAQGTGSAQVTQAIEIAKAANKKADSLQGAWVTTEKLIKQAEAAAMKGENDKALELAKKAQREAELAYAQAEHERKHWSPPPYLTP